MSIPKAHTEDREIRILLADDDQQFCERVSDFLANNGFYTRYARNGLEVKNILLTWKPDYILVDLMLPEVNALQLLRHLGPQALGQGPGKIKVIVFSGHSHEANVRECLLAGAVDYLVKPMKYVDLLSRLVLHTQKKREIENLESASAAKSKSDEALHFMHLTDLVLREALKNLQLDETLFNLTRMVSMALKAVRVSVVACDGETRTGNVLGSSDLRQIGDLTLDLNKYPEILYVLNTQKTLALDNLLKDPTMASVAKQNKSINFNSMVVAPVRFNSHAIWGVLSVRMSENNESMSDAEIRFVQLVSHVVGLSILKDRTNQSASRQVKKSA